MCAPRRLSALVAVLCLAAVTEGRAGEDAKPAPSPAIRFLMPSPGAFIPSGPVIVAGRLPPGAGFVNLILDGSPLLEVTREGAAFSATLTPRPGPHALEARAGDLTATITFGSGTGGRGAAPYRYHTPVLEGRCAECHTGVRRATVRAEAETCTACHRKLAVFFPYVHGPVAAGKCLVCHDPHGSNLPALATSDPKSLCTGCHDQPSSLAHIDQARSRVCYLCHNPHASMNRRFLYDIVK
ncbi:MAG TPA: cytochrome c3 family protein [Candidatus Methanoperedens sp.]|nr:cytochrome c3 family protein [Candidatus Methanoperedens sp.]